MMKSNASDCTSRWVPLSYPSAAIFVAAAGENNARIADPFFPLHRDVLLAAMRELLILDAKIDPRTMEVTPTSKRGISGMAAVGETEVANLGPPHNQALEVPMPRKRKGINRVVDASSDDEEKLNGFSSLKKQRTQDMIDMSADSLATLQKQVVEDGKNPQCHQPHVVPIAVDHQEQKVPFNYAQFKSAEALVDYAVKGGMLATAGTSEQYDNSQASDLHAKEAESHEKVTSKRKVSDASDLEQNHDNYLAFPACIVSLVRSNIMLLQTSQTGSKLSNLTPQSGTDLDPNSANSVETDHAIVSFLRHPKLQREQQQGNGNKSMFVLPRLLGASIEDERNLRARAHQMVSSMINSIPGNDLNIPLRAFLGYKSPRTPGKERILKMISDFLFDSSHAMYAWNHTESEMTRAQGKGVSNKTNYNSMDVEIKASLFDDRALKRIGGFEPSSLLPLAIGIHRCRQAKRSWKEYALSKEGRAAMSVHCKHQTECSGGGHSTEGETSTSYERKKRSGSITDALLEIGKKHRWRRGKSMISS